MARTKPVAQLNDWRLFRLNRDRWNLRWSDSDGKHRITFQAPNLETAIVEAHTVRESGVKKGKKYQRHAKRQVRQNERIRISDALVRSAHTREWTEKNRRNDSDACRYFLDWIDTLDLHWWNELRLETIEGYVKHLRDKGKKPMTIRHYLKPVKRTAAWVSANFQTANICQALVLPKLTHSNRVKVLSLHEGLDFLDWLARAKPCEGKRHCECVKRQQLLNRLIPGVALQLLLGLRLTEALGVTWEDVEQDTVTIRGQKTQYSHRILPMPELLIFILWHWGNDGKTLVKPYNDYSHYSCGLRKALRYWRPGQTNFAPKDIRKTLFREAKRRGFYGYNFEAFMGHSASQMLDITRRHYDHDQAESLLPAFRKEVLPAIEEGIRTWAPEETPTILPGPRLLRVIQG